MRPINCLHRSDEICSYFTSVALFQIATTASRKRTEILTHDGRHGKRGLEPCDIYYMARVVQITVSERRLR
jgi:hypothetical protein